MMTSISDISPAMQDYLKILYQLEQQGESLTNSAVASALELSAASVSGMMKKLADRGCVTYSPYRHIELTEVGRAIALTVIRRHRILELFLVDVLGMSWDAVHEEAEALEHVISNELLEAMATHLNDPKFDPHGHPIPRPGGEVIRRKGLRALLNIPEGETVVIREVSDADPEALRYLEDQGLGLGTELMIESIHPFEGPFELKVGGRVIFLSRVLASRVRVEVPVNAGK